MAQQISPYGEKPLLSTTNSSRPITSCLECYRRKQRCNRRRPCNRCLARHIPDKCCFADDVVLISGPSPIYRSVTTSSEAETDEPEDTKAPPCPPNLVTQIGYSASPGSSTYLALKRLNLCKYDSPQAALPSPTQQKFEALYLQIVARLPPPDIVNAFLEYFFYDVYWTFMVVDEHYLQSLFNQWLTTPVEDYIRTSLENSNRELLYFPALLFQMLAQILHDLSPQHDAAKALKLNTYSDLDRLSREYHVLGCKMMTILGRHSPTLSSIEHDIIAAAWLKDSSRGTEAWYRLGDAIRQAQELGLHRLPSANTQAPDESLESMLLNAWDLEHRKLIWTRLFILDSLMGFLLGRPRLIHRDDVSTPAPLNIEYPKNPARTLPLPSDEPPFFGIPIFLSLAQKIHDLRSLSARGIFNQDYSKLLAIHDEIYSLRHDLPPTDYQGNATVSKSAVRLSVLRLSLLNSMNAVLLALHRPFITTQAASRSAAVTAALEMLDSLKSIFNLIPHSQSRFYGTTFATFETCVFLCGIMMELPPQDSIEEQRIMRAILQGIERLSMIKDRSSVAQSGEPILLQMYRHVRAARPSTFEEPAWFLQLEQTDGSEGRDKLKNVYFPSPHLPPYETFRSLFGSHEQGSVSSFDVDVFQDQILSLDSGNPTWGDIDSLS